MAVIEHVTKSISVSSSKKYEPRTTVPLIQHHTVIQPLNNEIGATA